MLSKGDRWRVIQGLSTELSALAQCASQGGVYVLEGSIDVVAMGMDREEGAIGVQLQFVVDGLPLSVGTIFEPSEGWLPLNDDATELDQLTIPIQGRNLPSRMFRLGEAHVISLPRHEGVGHERIGEALNLYYCSFGDPAIFVTAPVSMKVPWERIVLDENPAAVGSFFASQIHHLAGGKH